MAEAPTMSLWTVYERPADYPESYVARRFEVQGGRAFPTSEVLVSGDLGKIQAALEWAGLHRLVRFPDDEPQIVETWM